MRRTGMLGAGLVRWAAAACTLAVLPAASGCVMTMDSVERKTLSLEIQHVADSGIDVQTENGGVSIKASSGATQVSVTAEVRARTMERAEAVKVVAERTRQGVLTLRAEWPEGKRLGNEGVSFDVTLPDAHGVTVKTGNGAVSLAGLSGDANVETSNGRIEVDGHAGPLVANTSNGRIEIEGVEGSAKVRTSNGAVSVEHNAGPVDAVTTNGRIEISLRDGVQGACSARTSNGAITFKASSSMKATLDLSTSNGSIVVKKDGKESTFKREAQVVLNGGGPTCTLSTSNGRITVEVDSGD